MDARCTTRRAERRNRGARLVRAWALCFALGLPAANACTVRDDGTPSVSPRADGGLSRAERALVLAMHQACRAMARPTPAPPLPRLRWSSALARDAQAWARACRFEHADTPEGENLAYATHGDVAAMVRLWIDEAPAYRIATGRCAGPACGHYTQMVWRDTRELGCGAAECAFGRLLVCRYAPAGNVVGRKPY